MKFLLRLLLSVVIVLPALPSRAQTADMMREDTMLFSRPLWNFWLGPSMVQAAWLEGTPTEQTVSPRSSVSGQAGFDYIHPLGIRFGLRTGLHVGNAPYRIRLELFRYPGNNLATDVQGIVISNYDQYYANVPVQLEFRRRGGENHYQVARLGLVGVMGMSRDASGETYVQPTSSGQDIEVFQLKLSTPIKSFVRPAFAASLGIYMVQKNHHLFSMQLSGRYLFKPLLSGTYELFPGTADDTRGTAEIYGNYIGVELGYTLTKFRQQEQNSRAE